MVLPQQTNYASEVSPTNTNLNTEYANFLTKINNITDAWNIISDVINLFSPIDKTNLITQILNTFESDIITNKEISLNLISNIINNFSNFDKSEILSQLLNQLNDIKEKSRTIIVTLQSMQENGTDLIKKLYQEIQGNVQSSDSENEPHENKRQKTQTTQDITNKKGKKQPKQLEADPDIEMTNNLEETTPTSHTEQNNFEINNEFQFPKINDRKRRITETKQQPNANSSSKIETTPQRKSKAVPPITLIDNTYIAIKKAQTKHNFNIKSAKDINN